jgi:hypothetical protein
MGASDRVEGISTTRPHYIKLASSEAIILEQAPRSYKTLD